MIKIMKCRVVTFTVLLCLVLFIAITFISTRAEKIEDVNEKNEIQLVSTETEYLKIDIGCSENYKIIFSTGDNIVYDTTLAKQLSSEFKKYGLSIYSRADSEAEKDYEILLGDTNRDAKNPP